MKETRFLHGEQHERVMRSANDDDNEGPIQSFELSRIDAPGSPPGTETVPEKGRVTFISLFATWDGISQDKMDQLGEAAATVDDDVQFVSVTDELIGETVDREDVVEWWADHDGAWPVVHDAGHELTQAIGEPRVPYSVVFDADNRVTWSEGG